MCFTDLFGMKFFTMGFFGLCSHGAEGEMATKCTPLKISKTENDLSMKLSSHKHVSFVSIVCLLLYLICVTWCDHTPSNYVATGNLTMAAKREKHNSWTVYNDKRSITLTLCKYIMEQSYLSSLFIKEKQQDRYQILIFLPVFLCRTMKNTGAMNLRPFTSLMTV